MENKIDDLIGIQYVVCECGECFENEDDLKIHFQNNHPEWTVKNENIDEEYAVLKQSLKPKEKKKRPLPRNKVCEYCGRKYVSTAALTNHQRTHTGEKPFECSVCSKCFAMRILLRIHMRTHTGEKPYVCCICDKRFNNKTALNRHTKVHTGEKPHLCPECNKGFSQSNSMKLHVMTVHLKMPAPYKDKRKSKITNQYESDDNEFECPYE